MFHALNIKWVNTRPQTQVLSTPKPEEEFQLLGPLHGRSLEVRPSFLGHILELSNCMKHSPFFKWPTVPHLVKNLLQLYATRNLTAVFTRGRYLSLA